MRYRIPLHTLFAHRSFLIALSTFLIALFSSLITLSSCSDSALDAVLDQHQPITVEFCLAGNKGDFIDTRISDTNQAPDYLYAFMVFEGEGRQRVMTKVYHTSATGEDNSISWSMVSGNRFSTKVSFTLPEGFGFTPTVARAYLVASLQPLLLSTGGRAIDPNSLTEDMICHMITDGRKDASGNDLSLRDIYSTPCNLTSAGRYYVTAVPSATGNIVFGSDKAPVILYHIASRIDVSWEPRVPESGKAVGVATVYDAPAQGYVFLPTANVYGVSYTRPLVYTPEVYDYMPTPHIVTLLSDDYGSDTGSAYAYFLQPQDNRAVIDVHCINSPSKSFTTDGHEADECFTSWHKIRVRL
ncbi:MAG: hypothetical protein KBT20_08485 [Bacteroidales bacterium]|nr:hypothetical protein [Candidatus Liminaster caballi]